MTDLVTRAGDQAARERAGGTAGGSLARRLDTADAVVIGLGSMIGAGVFSALGPAAESAGGALLLGLAVAALVAYANATSSAQLAALYPTSGGTYFYGRERLGPFWGFLAGWGFVIGKTASCAAMALTFGAYAAPSAMRPLAVGAVVALVTLNLLGIRRTAQATRLLVAVVLAALAAVLVGALFGGQADVDNLSPFFVGDVYGVLQAAGLLFFAFAGYARIATLGEEVRDPARTIPARSHSRSASRSSSTPPSPSPRCLPSVPSASPAPMRRWRRPSAPDRSTGSRAPCASAPSSARLPSCCRCSRASAAPRSPWRESATCRTR